MNHTNLRVRKNSVSDFYYFGGGGRYFNPDSVVERFLIPEQLPDMSKFDFGENPLRKNIDVNGNKISEL